MKKISIFREGGDPVYLFDNDTSELAEYTRRLTSAFKSTNVVILETSESSLVIRPHKVDAIEVVESENIQDEVVSDNINEETQVVIAASKENNEHVDMITDGE